MENYEDLDILTFTTLELMRDSSSISIISLDR